MELRQLINKLDKKELEDLVNKFNCYDGIVDYIGDDAENWRDCVDSSLADTRTNRNISISLKRLNLNCNSLIEGVLTIKCDEYDGIFFCTVFFKPNNNEELISKAESLDKIDELPELNGDRGYVLENAYKLNEKERDELFLWLFPKVNRALNWLVYSKMETVADPLSDAEARELILDKLCKEMTK